MDFQTMLNRAHEIAAEAIKAELLHEPENPNAFDCGFAWVSVNPATSPFIVWCRKQAKVSDNPLYGSKRYGGGWQFWCPGNYMGQSIRVFRKGAEAFSGYLQTQGYNASTGSRLD